MAYVMAYTVEDSMSTWEQRMAQRAAARRAAEPTEPVLPPQRNELDEQTIAAEAREWTPARIAAWRDGPAIGCACVGAPPGCTLCYCHLRAEAIALVEGEPCPWPHGGVTA